MAEKNILTMLKAETFAADRLEETKLKETVLATIRCKVSFLNFTDSDLFRQRLRGDVDYRALARDRHNSDGSSLRCDAVCNHLQIVASFHSATNQCHNKSTFSVWRMSYCATGTIQLLQCNVRSSKLCPYMNN